MATGIERRESERVASGSGRRRDVSSDDDGTDDDVERGFDVTRERFGPSHLLPTLSPSMV